MIVVVLLVVAVGVAAIAVLVIVSINQASLQCCLEVAAVGLGQLFGAEQVAVAESVVVGSVQVVVEPGKLAVVAEGIAEIDEMVVVDIAVVVGIVVVVGSVDQGNCPKQPHVG